MDYREIDKRCNVNNIYLKDKLGLIENTLNSLAAFPVTVMG